MMTTMLGFCCAAAGALAIKAATNDPMKPIQSFLFMIMLHSFVCGSQYLNGAPAADWLQRASDY
jgi:hypothetical protein